jgi:hypothetical protein
MTRRSVLEYAKAVKKRYLKGRREVKTRILEWLIINIVSQKPQLHLPYEIVP